VVPPDKSGACSGTPQKMHNGCLTIAVAGGNGPLTIIPHEALGLVPIRQSDGRQLPKQTDIIRGGTELRVRG